MLSVWAKAKKDAGCSGVVITNQWLHQHAASGYGGWTLAQFKVLGIKWPPYGGWKRDVIGRVIDDATAEAFARAKNELRPKTKVLRRKRLRAAQDAYQRDWVAEQGDEI